MRLHPGERATIAPVESDRLILHFQRQVTITRVVDDGYMVRVGAGTPGEEYGPIPEDRLIPGWREADGRVRS
jgi:hypothetical protein